jgi:hypothetical protein
MDTKKIITHLSEIVDSEINERKTIIIGNIMSKRQALLGLGLHSSTRLFEDFLRICNDELAVRAKIIWDSFLRIHSASGKTNPDNLQNDLKKQFELILNENFDKISAYFKNNIEEMPGVNTSPFFEKIQREKNQIITNYFSEIELYFNSITAYEIPDADETSPFQPDTNKQTTIHNFENAELTTKEQLEKLIKLMFDYPEREFYLFMEVGKKQNPRLKKAAEKNIILLNEVDCFYFKHPDIKNDYIKIPGKEIQNDWQKKIIQTRPKFIRITLKLTKKTQRELEISYKNFRDKQKLGNPFEFKPNFCDFGVDLENVWPWIKKAWVKIKNKTLLSG